jgi:hypothetical protein
MKVLPSQSPSFENKVTLREVYMDGLGLPPPDLTAVLMVRTDEEAHAFERWILDRSPEVSVGGGMTTQLFDFARLTSQFAGLGLTEETYYFGGWDVPSVALWSNAAVLSVQITPWVESVYEDSDSEYGDTGTDIDDDDTDIDDDDEDKN